MKSLRLLAGIAAIAELTLSSQVAIAIPISDRNGDFTSTGRGRGHIYWQVVDPDPNGLNCRMTERFQGIYADALNTPDEFLSRDYKPNISRWTRVHRFATGERLRAVTGNGMNQHIQFDDRGKPWMAVRISDVRGDCFVRANIRFVRPIRN